MPEKSITSRVQTLEDQSRIGRRAIAVLSVIAGAVVWMGQVKPAPAEVRTRSIVLLDSDGKVRGEFSADGTQPSLTLRDHQGRILIRLTGNGTRAILEYQDESGRMQDLAVPGGVRMLK